MKKFFLILFLLLQTRMAFGAKLSVLDEAAQLGTMAGLAQACGAQKKLDDYELIAARIIANKSGSIEAEQMGYRRYAEEKVNAAKIHLKSPKMSCSEIIHRFEKMPIFKSIVYKDGSLKFYDGTFYPAKGMYAIKK